MTTHYNVIFEGKAVPGKDIDSVKKALGNLLKADANDIERLFSGKPVSIKKNASAATAEKFQKAFTTAGAICSIKPVDVPAEGETIPHHGTTKTPLPPVERIAAPPLSGPSIKTALTDGMFITNIETVPGKSVVEHFGLVSGNTIRAKHLGKDILAGLKNLLGGELKSYTKLLQESREQAMERMIEQARQLGANAIVNIRFSTSSVTQGAAELYAYGTALRVE
jgi:uncharacterized protein YbjQ (UPF0145 family)